MAHCVPTPPDFSDTYTVKGTLYIPYAEIREPFYSWYDLKLGSSRIDYYGGEVCSQVISQELFKIYYFIIIIIIIIFICGYPKVPGICIFTQMVMSTSKYR
jgi:hypothetical protein